MLAEIECWEGDTPEASRPGLGYAAGMGGAAILERYERALRAHWDGQLELDRWWPGRSRWEVIVGAILVQNTAWANAALAIASLRAARRLQLARLRELSEAELGALIRSAGFWRQKARSLRGFTDWLDAFHGGSLRRLFAQPTSTLREQLLGLRGIGEETADAILVFAGGRARFILDAYSRRILGRHRLPAERGWIEARLGADARRHRHLHALLVETAKRYCRKTRPDCAHCPLEPFLPGTGTRLPGPGWNSAVPVRRPRLHAERESTRKPALPAPTYLSRPRP